VNGKGIGESSHFVENSEVHSGDETIVIEDENEGENENEGSVYEDSEQNAHSDESDYEMAFKFGSSFGYFDESREDIESYISRLKSVMVVGKVPDDHKIHALISSLGPEAYSTLRNLCVPVDPTTKSFNDCVKLSVDHYTDVNLLSVQHFKLDNRVQQVVESVAKYAEALSFLTRSCKFADATAVNSYLSNVFPRNLLDERIKMIVIPENLGFEDCVKRAKALESTYSQLSIVNTKPPEATATSSTSQAFGSEEGASTVHALKYKSSYINETRQDSGVQHGKPRQFRQDQSRQWRPRQQQQHYKACWRCGGGNYSHDSCWCRQSRCYSCGGTGHLSRMCYNARRKEKNIMEKKQSKYKSSGKVNFAAEPSSLVSTCSDSESDDSDVGINVICSIQKSDIDFSISCSVNNIELLMQVDTCADVTIIPYEIFKEKYPDIDLHKFSDSLTTYGGKPLKILGECTVCVTYNNKKFNDMPLVVVDANAKQPILFGKNWLSVIALD
jgi:hypothetical protein